MFYDVLPCNLTLPRPKYALERGVILAGAKASNYPITAYTFTMSH